MYRDSKRITKSSQVLLYLLAASDIVYRASLMRRMSLAFYPEYKKYIANRRMDTILYKLVRQGWIKEEYKETKKILKLTQRGELEALFQKAYTQYKPKKWDGKWRMVIFDIPENARHVRNQLRKLLKAFGFRAIQASVYVFPFAVSVAAVDFLKKSKLTRYIRFARVEAFDDDADLRKLFRHVIPKSDGRLS